MEDPWSVLRWFRSRLSSPPCLPTGFSGEQIRADLRFGPQYRVIQGVRDEHYSVEGDVVTADFVLDVGRPPLASARVHETFTLDGGRLRTIIAITSR